MAGGSLGRICKDYYHIKGYFTAPVRAVKVILFSDFPANFG